MTAILDYGIGNVSSISNMLKKIGASNIITSNPEVINNAKKLILPGVGHFDYCMQQLRNASFFELLQKKVLDEKTPILGVCVGCQMLMEKSEEGNINGLGWFDAESVQFDISNKKRFKVPHMGWNRVTKKKNSLLMRNVPEFSEFYFVHSYHLKIRRESDLLSETEYEVTFPSAIEKNNIFGVQYHPEKSHDAGLQLIKNFIEM